MIAQETTQNVHSGHVQHFHNVGNLERVVSGIGGTLLALRGLKRGRLSGFLMVLAGGALIKRGISGHCSMYQMMGFDTTHEHLTDATNVQHGIKVEKTVVINRPAEELFHFWRNLENLPRFMSHVKSIQPISEVRSHWIVDGPGGATIEWDAEIVNETENELIAWRSLEGSDVFTAGSVRFTEIPVGGTEVKVSLVFNPPGGKIGAAVAKILGDDPEKQIEEELQRLKDIFDTIEVPEVKRFHH